MTCTLNGYVTLQATCVISLLSKEELHGYSCPIVFNYMFSINSVGVTKNTTASAIDEGSSESQYK